MSNNYPEPPRTQWAELALLSEASDPEEYRDIHGAVVDDENFRQLQKQVIAQFPSYSDFPSPAPFDGAKAEALDSNVVFRWDESAGDWVALNTGTASNPRPGTTHLTEATVESAPSGDTDVVRKVEADSKADLTAPDGVLQSSQVPDLSITQTFTVTDQAARLSLNVQEGDVAIQTDNDTTYIFTGEDPSVDSNWSEIQLDVLEAIDGSDITPSSVTTPSVEAKQADITDEEYIVASRGADSSSKQAFEWQNIADTEDEDNTNILNNSQQIVPSEPVRIRITAHVALTASAGDQIDLRVRDIDASDSIQTKTPSANLANTSGFVNLSTVADLNAGNAHEIQVTDADSSYSIASGSWFILTKELAHP